MSRWTAILLMLAFCSFAAVSAESPKPEEAKKNMASYTGKVEPMGMSIFMQGSHQLVDAGGQMIVILQSDGKVDLNKFVGKQVTVEGSEEGTVEAGGKILTVESIKGL